MPFLYIKRDGRIHVENFLILLRFGDSLVCPLVHRHHPETILLSYSLLMCLYIIPFRDIILLFFFLYYHNRFGGLLDADHSSSSGRYYTHYAICPAIGEILCILLLFLFIILTFQFDPSTVVGISLVTYIYSRHI